jgi:hypothetical protein
MNMSLQVYTPYICNIVEVDQGQTTVITTDVVHAFVFGSLVAFNVPKEYGMRQLTALKGYVIDLTDTTITVTIDSTQFDAFVVPVVGPTVVLDPALVIPAGDANSGTSAPGGTLESLTIPGAYQAIVN